MKKMRLDEIKIKESFNNTTPKEEKMEVCRKNWVEHQKQDRYIVVNHNNELIDGYIQYLILKENNIEEAEIKLSDRKKKCWARIGKDNIPRYRDERTIYIYGIHFKSKCRKEYVWRIPKSWIQFASNVQIGDVIRCNAKRKKSSIVVTKIEELNKCPVDFRVKRVASKQIKRNGMVIEYD